MGSLAGKLPAALPILSLLIAGLGVAGALLYRALSRAAGPSRRSGPFYNRQRLDFHFRHPDR